jgi:hypothetical protein
VQTGAANPKAAHQGSLSCLAGSFLRILYLDEAGDLQTLPIAPHANTDQPVFVLGGISIDATRLRHVTLDFLKTKKALLPRPQLPQYCPARRHIA